MSLLRIARPGHQTVLIDEGPSSAVASRRGIRGGSDNPVMGHMPTGESERQRDNRLSRESKARLRVPV